MKKIKKNQDRQSNIELLRIFSILGVIILHYNNISIGGALKFVTPNSANYLVLVILESICICAVNVFVIITGYFLIQKQSRDFWKVIELIFQVIIVQFCYYIFKDCIIDKNFSIKGLISSLIPNNYFVILYCTLFIISPYINKTTNQLNIKQYKKFLIILFVIFAIYPTIVDLFNKIANREFNGLSTIGAYGSQYGYTIVNFILMYLIGGYIYKYSSIVKSKKLIIYFFINLIMIITWSFVDTNTAWEYCNPFVIIEAILIFMIFKNMNFTNKAINKFATGSFFVFLLHDKFLELIRIELFANATFIITITHIIISSILIYIICYTIFAIYDKLSYPILNYVKSKIKIPEISVDIERSE